MDSTTVKRIWYFDVSGITSGAYVTTTRPGGPPAREFTGTAAEFAAHLRDAGITQIEAAPSEITSYEIRREWAIRLRAEELAAEYASYPAGEPDDPEHLMRFALDAARHEARRRRHWDATGIRRVKDYEGQPDSELLFYSSLTGGMVSVIPVTDAELCELRDKITVYLEGAVTRDDHR